MKAMTPKEKRIVINAATAQVKLLRKQADLLKQMIDLVSAKDATDEQVKVLGITVMKMSLAVLT